ncbi:MAG: glycoside hydrolase family 57 protein, partial [Phycisphaerales bacterium]|nr:glycoside hydrolase family 57 protein [Phycisphaerales bacterium]
MASVCFYFQVHQPFRIRRYSVFDTDPFYFDDEANRQILEKVADKCYRPTTRLIRDLVKRYDGAFRASFSITNVALQQFQAWAPDLVELFQELAASGCVEFLGETSHHSLSFLYSREEFSEQLTLHDRTARAVFGAEPTVFRNTELIYSNEVATHLAAYGQYNAVICEGVDRLLGFRSPNFLYAPPGTGDRLKHARIKLLLKNYRLSDDIAFRFSDRNWTEWPLRAETFARWVDQINGNGNVCNLFMDYETFGEHQWAETGIFDFLEALPEKVLQVNPGHNDFRTPSECVAAHAPVGEYNVPHAISWADT